MGHAAREHDEHLHIELLPDMAEVFDGIEEYLGKQGRQAFEDELVHAFFASMKTGSDRPMNETVQAWYRTLLFKRSGVDKRLAELPEEDVAEAMSMDEVREYLNI